MKLIQLTHGRFARVDDEDYDTLIKFKWYPIKRGNTFYAERRKTKNDNHVSTKMHRLIMNITNSKKHIDHIDRDGLNNQKANLRECDRSQNMCNRNSSKNSTSKYLGVNIHKSTQKWHSQIRNGNKYIYLGLFEKEEDAAIAYNEAAQKYHGEFANLNIIPH